jgi:hypothetical protein
VIRQMASSSSFQLVVLLLLNLLTTALKRLFRSMELKLLNGLMENSILRTEMQPLKGLNV